MLKAGVHLCVMFSFMVSVMYKETVYCCGLGYLAESKVREAFFSRKRKDAAPERSDLVNIEERILK